MTEIPSGSVVVTPTEMYAELRNVRDEIRRLSTLVDPALTEVRGGISKAETRIDAIDGRLRAVEIRAAVLSVVATIVGGGGGFGLSVLTGG